MTWSGVQSPLRTGESRPAPRLHPVVARLGWPNTKSTCRVDELLTFKMRSSRWCSLSVTQAVSVVARYRLNRNERERPERPGRDAGRKPGQTKTTPRPAVAAGPRLTYAPGGAP